MFQIREWSQVKNLTVSCLTRQIYRKLLLIYNLAAAVGILIRLAGIPFGHVALKTYLEPHIKFVCYVLV